MYVLKIATATTDFEDERKQTLFEGRSSSAICVPLRMFIQCRPKMLTKSRELC